MSQLLYVQLQHGMGPSMIPEDLCPNCIQGKLKNISHDPIILKFLEPTFIESSESRIDISKERWSNSMHSSGTIFLCMLTYISGIRAEIIFKIPAAFKLVEKMRIEMKHNI